MIVRERWTESAAQAMGDRRPGERPRDAIQGAFRALPVAHPRCGGRGAQPGAARRACCPPISWARRMRRSKRNAIDGHRRSADPHRLSIAAASEHRRSPMPSTQTSSHSSSPEDPREVNLALLRRGAVASRWPARSSAAAFGALVCASIWLQDEGPRADRGRGGDAAAGGGRVRRRGLRRRDGCTPGRRGWCSSAGWP